jgi:hypothetical protein
MKTNGGDSSPEHTLVLDVFLSDTAYTKHPQKHVSWDKPYTRILHHSQPNYIS